MNSDRRQDRFAIDDLGMRELYAGLTPWRLLKELVQNVWDETPKATFCRVTIKPGSDLGETVICVEDDGPGFSDLEDTYTLMKHTDKRLDPTKRGRFNVGEKEVVAVALEAEIETVGYTVQFPREGGRKELETHRELGTLMRAVMPWREAQISKLEEKLAQFQPPKDCKTEVNGREIQYREPEYRRLVNLPTVRQEGEVMGSLLPEKSRMLKTVERTTEIHLLRRADKAQSWLYEMGIPIQEIETPWDVDVQQRVPMSQARDSVETEYLKSVYAECLNAAHRKMEKGEFGRSWVKQAMEDNRLKPESVRSTFTARYSDKAVLGGKDKEAELRASEDGYYVIPPQSLSATEKRRFEKDAGLEQAEKRFRRPKVDYTPVSELDDPSYPPFIAWVQEMGRHCGLNATVQLVSAPDATVRADCTANTPMPCLRFNVALLGPEFFRGPLYRPEQISLLCHEFGHALSGKPMEHGPEWGEAVAKAAGDIVAAIHRDPAA